MKIIDEKGELTFVAVKSAEGKAEFAKRQKAGAKTEVKEETKKETKK